MLSQDAVKVNQNKRKIWVNIDKNKKISSRYKMNIVKILLLLCQLRHIVPATFLISHKHEI